MSSTHEGGKLVRLIHAMSTSEKAFFKRKTSQTETDRKYIVLFDIVDKLRPFDKEKFNHKIGKKELSKHLEVTKNYLYSLILYHLRQYHATRSPKFRLQNEMQEIQLLYDLGLTKDCINRLSKVRGKLIEAEEYGALYELFLIESKLYHEITPVRNYDDLVEEYRAYTEEGFHFIADKLFESRGVLRSKQANIHKTSEEGFLQIIDDIDQRLANRRSKSSKAVLTKEKAHFLACMGNYSDSIDCLDVSYNYILEKQKQWHNAHFDMLTNRFLLSACFSAKERFPLAYNIVDGIMVSLKKNRNTLSRRSFYLLFILSIKAKIYLLGTAMCYVQIEDLIETFEMDMLKVSMIYSLKPYYLEYLVCLSVVRIEQNEIDKALLIINEILNSGIKLKGGFIELITRILFVLCNYEKGNRILMESIVRSTRRYMTERDEKKDVEETIVNYLYKITRTIEREKKHQLWNELKDKISYYKEVPEYAHLLSEFDFESWIESKIQGISFTEYLRSARKEHIGQFKKGIKARSNKDD